MILSRGLFKLPLKQVQYFGRRKDYYAILGISKTATEEQIREAYAKKAQKLYPNVTTSVAINDASAQQEFQDVAEAFAVLSQIQSRNAYDLLNKEQPDLLYGAEMERYKQSFQRNDDGTYKRPGQVASDYAKEKQEYLKKERSVFNVDDLGRYKGGVPRPNKGYVRGNALMGVGQYHRPLYHNMKQNPFETEHRITSEDAQYFRVWSTEERTFKEWSYLHQNAVVDYEYLKFNDYRIFYRWVRNFFLVFLAFPYFFQSLFRGHLREIIDEINEEMAEGLPIVGRQFGNLQVVVGKTGTLKLQDVHGGHHHH
ncbi:unnamed protein product [Paramecium octaurelia]|uniref:J domain-containing protein n=1 Tax=Paramecium octaurelia TaxID=43137 RepID=A0A8S1VJQ6_PAROT|nr:unnamed protein product [Paramecium octaurelia]